MWPFKWKLLRSTFVWFKTTTTKPVKYEPKQLSLHSTFCPWVLQLGNISQLQINLFTMYFIYTLNVIYISIVQYTFFYFMWLIVSELKYKIARKNENIETTEMLRLTSCALFTSHKNSIFTLHLHAFWRFCQNKKKFSISRFCHNWSLSVLYI